jgi:hypothetical protein
MPELDVVVPPSLLLPPFIVSFFCVKCRRFVWVMKGGECVFGFRKMLQLEQ